MAQLVGNNPYLTIDGVNVVAYFVDVSITRKNEDIESTRGNGAHKQYEAGIDETSLDATIAWEIGSVQNYIAHLKPGLKVIVDYGPESNVGGKARHTQTFKLSNCGPVKQAAGKDKVELKISGVGDGVATADMFNGGVF